MKIIADDYILSVQLWWSFYGILKNYNKKFMNFGYFIKNKNWSKQLKIIKIEKKKVFSYCVSIINSLVWAHLNEENKIETNNMNIFIQFKLSSFFFLFLKIIEQNIFLLFC